MPTLHLMVGLPCAGKTTYSKKLEKEINALRLTPDEWHVRLFGQDVEDPDHNRRHDTIEDLLWGVAASVLGHGIDVILDFGFWKRIERDDYRSRAASLGASTKIHYLSATEDVLLRRLDIRNDVADPGVAKIPRETLMEWMGHFEPPDEDELT